VLLQQTDQINGKKPLNSCGDSSAQIANFCADPVQAICANPKTHRTTRLGQVAEARESIEEEALEFVVKKYRLAKTQKLTKAILDVERRGFSDQELAAKVLGDFQDKKKELRLNKTEDGIDELTNSQFPLFKKNLQRAIEASALPSDKKKAFNNYLNGEKFYSFDEIMERGRDDSGWGQRAREAMHVCEVDGLNFGAQAEDSKEARQSGKQRLLLCSGMSVTKGAGFSFDKLAMNFMVASHEMSHVMSAYWEPQIYANLQKCFGENYSETFVQTYLDEARKQPDFDKEYEAQVKANSARLVAAYMEELTPDFWAQKAVGQYLMNEGKTLKPAEKMAFLQNAYGYFCGGQGSGAGGHPSGNVRIELMGVDSNIRSALGCKTPPKKVSCDI
jgi:hypothetical protein